MTARTIATVEDDAGMREALGRMLRAAGFESRGYASAEGFLEDPSTDPGCLVLDVQLPGASGLDLQRRLNVNRGYGGSYYGGCCYHPVATAAAVTAATMVTAAIVGSIVNTLPTGCTVTVVNRISYQRCGSAWYQPQYAGGSVQYVVVGHP